MWFHQAIARGIKRARYASFVMIVVLGVFPGVGHAIKSVSAFALFNGRAILLIDGQQRMLRAGQTSVEGVTLISSSTSQATIEIDGRQETLALDIIPALSGTDEDSPAIAEDRRVALDMHDSGFFFAQGEINGQSVDFLVDTGANSVAMNVSTAQRLGIDYEAGQKAWASTANGNVPMYLVTLETVTVGPIEVSDVAAAIITDPGPEEILLGMSFLGELEMSRVGESMVLIQR